MSYQIPDDVLVLMKQFTDNGYSIYIVGGAVRDLLMGREVHDFDFTTDAFPEEILKIVTHGFYNNQFGTVGIVRSSIYGRQSTVNEIQTDDGRLTTVDDNQTEIFEITTMRKESEYLDFRHPQEIVWTDHIDEDLARRDFTINAQALGFGKGEKIITLIDPFNGKEDLDAQLIKAVGDPQKRLFEDALRLMRAVRFATQLNFTIEEKTMQAIKENAHLIAQISWERIRDELLKILASDSAYQGISLLKEVGLLQYILPEIVECFSVEQEGPKHDREYNIGAHSLLSLKECPSKDPIIKLATLLHDVGKVATLKISPDGNTTFYGHEIIGAKLASSIAKRLRLSKKQIDTIYKLVRYHMFTIDEHQTDSAIRRFIKNIGVENIDNMMALRVGDRLGGGTKTATSWRLENFKERIEQVMQKPFSVTDLKVNGLDVMELLQIKPSRKVGEILDALFLEVSEDQSKNDREYLLKRIKEL